MLYSIRKSWIRWLLLVFFILIPVGAVPAKHVSTKGSSDLVKTFVDHVTQAEISESQLQDRKPASEIYRTEREQWFRKEFPSISAHISYDIIVEGVCSAKCREYWRSPGAKAHFQELFVKLVSQVAYPKAHDFFKKIKELTYKDPVVESDGRIRIDASALYQKTNNSHEPIHFAFYLEQKGERWIISDFAVEGERLVESWRDQINNVLAKEGYESLISRMQQKLERVMSNLAL